MSKSVVAIVIDEGAHHLDLRSANPADPPSVIKAREIETSTIRNWLKEYAETRQTTYHLLLMEKYPNLGTFYNQPFC